MSDLVEQLREFEGRPDQNEYALISDAADEIERLLAVIPDLYYLRSILGHLREMRSALYGPALGGEILADNIDWLDCYIDRCAKSVQNDETRKGHGGNDGLSTAGGLRDADKMRE